MISILRSPLYDTTICNRRARYAHNAHLRYCDLLPVCKAYFKTRQCCSSSKAHFKTSQCCSSVKAHFQTSQCCSSGKAHFQTSQCCFSGKAHFQTSQCGLHAKFFLRCCKAAMPILQNDNALFVREAAFRQCDVEKAILLYHNGASLLKARSKI